MGRGQHLLAQLQETYHKLQLGDIVTGRADYPQPMLKRRKSWSRRGRQSFPRASARAIKIDEKLKVPSTNNLTLIKWKDQDERKRKFKLISQISDKWHETGLAVDLHENALTNYRQKYIDNDERCRHILSDWINEGHDEYPCTWQGVYNLVHDVDKHNVAEELSEVLTAKGIYLNHRK